MVDTNPYIERLDRTLKTLQDRVREQELALTKVRLSRFCERVFTTLSACKYCLYPGPRTNGDINWMLLPLTNT